MRYAVPLFLALLPTLAPAQDKAGTTDCYCTDSGGDRIELGEMICLQVGGRMFTAQCQMSLNVPMWREIENGCLTGALDGPEQGVPGDAEAATAGG